MAEASFGGSIDSRVLFESSLSSPCNRKQIVLPLSLPPFPSDFPQTKVIPKTRFVVDGFDRAGEFCISYFLSHFHSDHYRGLTSSWASGVIFCADITARLLVEILNIRSQFVIPLPLSQTVHIDGCEVTLIDANHCPGAVQFLFRVPKNNQKFEKFIHTGDFRYCDSMKSEPILTKFVGADSVFLDTTYCNPRYVFPSQEESINYVVDAIHRIRTQSEGAERPVLFLVATYVIGKEKILLEIGRRCSCKIHVSGRKMEVLRILGYGETGLFTVDPSECYVHVVGWNVLGVTWPYFGPNFAKMKEIMHEKGYARVVGFVPTGWTCEVKHNKFAVRSKECFEIHLVPYSEHSNYNELREYVKFLRPKRVVPTVGVDVGKIDSKHVEKLLKHFSGLVDEMAIRQEFITAFNHAENTIGCHDLNLNVETELPDCDCTEYSNMQVASNASEENQRFFGSLNDNEREELLHQIRDCLPNWVTSEQLLDLLTGSGCNVVEAVSSFYERETEFHEQANACEGSVYSSQSCMGVSVTTMSSSKVDDERILHANASLDRHKHPGSYLTASTRSSFSSGRKRKALARNVMQRAKTGSSLIPCGEKQASITRFFSRIENDVSSPEGVGCTAVKQGVDKFGISSRDSSQLYSDSVTKFIHVVGGDNLSRTYVTSLLEMTKGDINKALDIHYDRDELEKNKEKPSYGRKLNDDVCLNILCSSENYPAEHA